MQKKRKVVMNLLIKEGAGVTKQMQEKELQTALAVLSKSKSWILLARIPQDDGDKIVISSQTCVIEMPQYMRIMEQVAQHMLEQTQAARKMQEDENHLSEDAT